jgi:hypothetical protein
MLQSSGEKSHFSRPLRHPDVIERSVGLQIGDRDVGLRQELYQVRQSPVVEPKIDSEVHLDFAYEADSKRQPHDNVLDLGIGDFAPKYPR